MIFDARILARGWLSVALAAGKDPNLPALCRTVHIEQYPQGVRLAATDGYMLLHTWVPGLECEMEPAPTVDEVPTATATARDVHGRAKALLSHLNQLAAQAEKQSGEPVEVRLRLGVPDLANQGQLEGMEAQYVLVEHPEHERLLLPVLDGGYPPWRTAYLGTATVPTEVASFTPEIMGRLAKLAQLHPTCRIGWHYGGSDRPARVEVLDSEPYVDGAVMPVAWDFRRDGPAEDPAPGPEPDEPMDPGTDDHVGEQLAVEPETGDLVTSVTAGGAPWQ